MYSDCRNSQVYLDISLTVLAVLDAPLMKLYESTVELELVAEHLERKFEERCSVICDTWKFYYNRSERSVDACYFVSVTKCKETGVFGVFTRHCIKHRSVSVPEKESGCFLFEAMQFVRTYIHTDTDKHTYILHKVMRNPATCLFLPNVRLQLTRKWRRRWQ
jgi:hypothetical protein